jgi:AcrR family transcriptional regulator
MANEGVVAKGIARREEILEIALDVFSRSGYRGTSLREVAEIAGLTQAGLLHHFGTRENLLVEVLRRKEQLGREEHPDVAGTPYGLSAALRNNTSTPGLVELHSVLATQAADQSHPAHDYFTDRYANMRVRLSADLRRRVASGEFDARVDPDRLATILVALADGLQVQWMLDDSIDMSAHFDELLALLRTDQAAPPVA